MDYHQDSFYCHESNMICKEAFKRTIFSQLCGVCLMKESVRTTTAAVTTVGLKETRLSFEWLFHRGIAQHECYDTKSACASFKTSFFGGKWWAKSRHQKLPNTVYTKTSCINSTSVVYILRNALLKSQ